MTRSFHQDLLNGNRKVVDAYNEVSLVEFLMHIVGNLYLGDHGPEVEYDPVTCEILQTSGLMG